MGLFGVVRQGPGSLVVFFAGLGLWVRGCGFVSAQPACVLCLVFFSRIPDGREGLAWEEGRRHQGRH